ncbi:hypothetical protein NC652_019881 [Populus alba x Populus x berolinensis]|nr:hypothetical protein NC652_019881 [Populus alba x Populus x berolinensis]
MILSLHSLTHHQHSPFKFLNIWADRIDFLPTVTSSWQVPVHGNPMYQFTTKLRRLKSTLRQFHFQHTSSITDRVSKAKTEWETAQVHLDNHPTSATAMATERSLASTYLQLCKDEESYYKQKSRVQWLQLGDRNTTFFHKSLLHRQVRNRIHNLQDEANLLRGRSFWHIPMPSNPSWSWRKIIQSREWCRGWFTTAIGNGSSTSLWFDYWLPEGKRLIDEYSMRTLTATGLSWTAQVSDIIKEGQWDFPQALHARLNSIPFQPKPWSADHCIWKGHSSGNFSINSAWESLRDRRPENTIHKLLWSKGHIPRQSFILWLASLGRLHTMDHLQSTGIIRNATCIFCGLQTETHEHLFFECQFSRVVWQTINAKASIHWPYLPWQNLLSWTTANYCKNTDIQHLIARLVLSTTVYYIWYERNNRIFKQIYRTSQELRDEAFEIIRACLMNKDHMQIPAIFKSIWNLTNA